MPPRVSREEWERRAAAVGIEWVGDEPIYASTKHVARCLEHGDRFMVYPFKVQQGQGCPTCGRQAAGLRHRVPRQEWNRRAGEVGIEWIGNEPFLADTSHAARCLTCSHEFVIRPSNVKDGQGCPACSGGWKTPLSREEWNRRAAQLGLEWVGDERVLANTKHSARCVACGHEWVTKPSNSSNCPSCSRIAQRLTPEEWRSRATAVGLEWIDEPPMLYTQHAAARCLACGYEYDANAGSVSSGGGCPSCAGVAPLTREEWNRRASAMDLEWIGNPPSRGAQHAIARCLVCGHEYETSGNNVAKGRRCPACAPNAPVAREEWDRRATAMGFEWIGGAPVASHAKHAIRCLTCGDEYEVKPYSVSNGHGCRSCAPHGFAPALPALVYLLRHEQGPLMKVGVTEARTDTRLRLHGRRGWERIATWPVPFGRDALAIEKEVVGWWRAAGANPCTREDVPDGHGWTEAVHITAAADEPRTIASIEELVAEVGGGY